MHQLPALQGHARHDRTLTGHGPLTLTLTLTLTPVNPEVYSVHRPDGLHVGNLKRIGAIWKFKAIGYDAAGHVIPGGGPLTGRHNTVVAAPDGVWFCPEP